MQSVSGSYLADEAGNVLWTRCLTCGAPLLSPGKKHGATCRNWLTCFLRFWRHRGWRPAK